MSEDRHDRREFYRIDDQVILRYKLLSAEEESERHDAFENYQPLWTTLHDSLRQIEREQSFLMDQIEENHPDLADYLQNLDQKIELIMRLVASQQDQGDVSLAEEISMSASGLGFFAKEPLPMGSPIELRFTLFADHLTILCYGTVVRSLAVEGNDLIDIGITFSEIKEVDREVLISHILKRQAVQLQERLEHADN